MNTENKLNIKKESLNQEKLHAEMSKSFLNPEEDEDSCYLAVSELKISKLNLK